MPHTRADVHNESSVLHPNTAIHSESETIRAHAEYSCDEVERHQRTQNNAKSPFFSKLPAEVRNTIYEMVLGGQWVHMDFGGASDTIKDEMWTARVCKIEPDASEYRTYEKWKREGRRPLKTFWQHHSDCFFRIERPFLQLDLHCLRVCKQMYHEAHLIPYSSNAFSFESLEYLHAFIDILQQRRQGQAAAIRNLHVNSVIGNAEINPTIWESGSQLSTGISGLRKLHLTIDARFKPLSLYRDVVSSDWKRQFWILGLLALGSPRLQNATVTIADWPDCPILWDKLLTHGEKEGWADDIIKDLLSWDANRRIDVAAEELEEYARKHLSPC